MAQSDFTKCSNRLCNNGVPSGYYAKVQVKFLYDSRSVDKFMPWRSKLCMTCYRENKANSASADRSKAISAEFTTYGGNPWHDMERLTNLAAMQIVKLIKALNPWSRCYWSYLGEPLAKFPWESATASMMPKSILYRVEA